jgi:hypothetical protein
MPVNVIRTQVYAVLPCYAIASASAVVLHDRVFDTSHLHLCDLTHK